MYAAAKDSDSELIRRHGELIERIASRLAARVGIAGLREELWSAGALGLVDASRRYDASRGIRFETFVEHRVRGAMLDELRRIDHLPRRLRDRAHQAAKARATLGQQHGRPATDDEVAAAMKMPVDELVEIDNVAQPPMPLDPEVLARIDQPTPEAEAEKRQLSAALAERVSRLPERLQLLLSLHYQEDRTYREIAEVLGVSEPRICQLHQQALALLREQVEEEEAA
ncbi:MAG TPA: sigma-70 family RNA polymerase sigma factor [Myxococcales bacterium]|nr:sigma-70 family RNA polymerase sigma factor [Myxococcales bacterium]